MLVKCLFLQDEVEYCGHLINKDGIRPKSDNVEAVREAPKPTCVSEVKAFLGMVNYYNAYLPNLSTVAEPLRGKVFNGNGNLSATKLSAIEF